MDGVGGWIDVFLVRRKPDGLFSFRMSKYLTSVDLTFDNQLDRETSTN